MSQPAPTPQESLRAGLNLFRRLPPSSVATSLVGVCALRPDLTEDFLQRVDQPLQVRVCAATKRKYIVCDYSRDGDSYRSPWSSAYDPPLDDGVQPPAGLRTMEVAANDLLDAYRELYYSDGAGSSVSSAYFWESGARGFACCMLIHKTLPPSSSGSGAGGSALTGGSWDSVHVFDVQPDQGAAAAGGKYTFKLTTTVLLSLLSDKAAQESSHGSLDLSGSLTRQASATGPVTADKGHVAIMGGMLEAMEGEVRASLDALYISKTREILGSLRPRGAGAAAAAAVVGGGGAGAGAVAGRVGLPGIGGAGNLVSDLSAALQKRTAATAAE
jgi:capping protein (actin filament) muscle Z-line, beta